MGPFFVACSYLHRIYYYSSSLSCQQLLICLDPPSPSMYNCNTLYVRPASDGQGRSSVRIQQDLARLHPSLCFLCPCPTLAGSWEMAEMWSLGKYPPRRALHSVPVLSLVHTSCLARCKLRCEFRCANALSAWPYPCHCNQPHRLPFAFVYLLVVVGAGPYAWLTRAVIRTPCPNLLNAKPEPHLQQNYLRVASVMSLLEHDVAYST
jgi:hypothetical protein